MERVEIIKLYSIKYFLEIGTQLSLKSSLEFCPSPPLHPPPPHLLYFGGKCHIPHIHFHPLIISLLGLKLQRYVLRDEITNFFLSYFFWQFFSITKIEITKPLMKRYIVKENFPCFRVTIFLPRTRRRPDDRKGNGDHSLASS